MRELDKQMKNIIVSDEWISSKNERMGLPADNGYREKKKKETKRNEKETKGKRRMEENGKERKGQARNGRDRDEHAAV